MRTGLHFPGRLPIIVDMEICFADDTLTLAANTAARIPELDDLVDKKFVVTEREIRLEPIPGGIRGIPASLQQSMQLVYLKELIR